MYKSVPFLDYLFACFWIVENVFVKTFLVLFIVVSFDICAIMTRLLEIKTLDYVTYVCNIAFYTINNDSWDGQDVRGGFSSNFITEI